VVCRAPYNGRASALPSATMTDPHHREAHTHLVRIQARLAEDAVAQQRTIAEKLTNTHLNDDAQRWLQAILDGQNERDPYSGVALANIARGVNRACEVLGLDVQKGVVRGLLRSRGIGAFSSDFYGTGVAIVGIDASVVPFTGMLTDLFAETFDYRDTEDGLAVAMNAADCLKRATGGKTVAESSQDAQEGRETLIHRWERFFLHFAGLSFAWSRPTLTRMQEIMKFQITSAMEVFVVGHEYGHHIHRHNAGPSATSSVSREDAERYEFEADRTAWAIAKYLGAAGFAGTPTEYRNTWMESSAGAVAYLVAAEVVRRVREILETGRETRQRSVSHPSSYDRLVALEEWDGFANHPLQAEFRAQRLFLSTLIQKIYWHIRPKFLAAHQAGYRPTHL
jgi:hypothetical protein